MPPVTITLPRLVSRAADTAHDVEVDAETVRGAIETLLDQHPAVRVHLFDEAGTLRPNVLCAVDEEPTRLLQDHPVTAGTRIRFVASVAGGAERSEHARRARVAGGAERSEHARRARVAGGAERSEHARRA